MDNENKKDDQTAAREASLSAPVCSGRFGNCFLWAITHPEKGQLIILKWVWPWPHFGRLDGKYCYHFRATKRVPWYKQLWFHGVEATCFVGDPNVEDRYEAQQPQPTKENL